MKKSCLALVLALCLMVPSFVSAADHSTAYGALKLGYFMPNDDSDGLKDFDSDFAFGLAGGVRIDQNIALELGWEYSSVECDDSGYEDGYLINANWEATTWSIPFTCKFILPAANDLDFFFGAGIGIYSTELEADYTVSGLGSGSDSESDTGIGFHVVGGVDLKIDRNLSLGVELKWSNAQLEFEDFSDDEINVGGTTFSVVGKYRF